MTAKELATTLSGREYGGELYPSEELKAKAAGLVVVYGYSDDNVELRGAIDAEVGAWNGTTIYVNGGGLLEEPDCGIAENCDCPYFAAAKKEAKTIEAIWCGGKAPWTFETDIPHETFAITEDGEPWCIGIVFSVADVDVAQEDNPDACQCCGDTLIAQKAPAKLDRSRWEGCKYCHDPSLGIWIWHHYKYCPYCGAPQNEEGWEELERRIERCLT